MSANPSFRTEARRLAARKVVLEGGFLAFAIFVIGVLAVGFGATSAIGPNMHEKLGPRFVAWLVGGPGQQLGSQQVRIAEAWALRASSSPGAPGGYPAQSITHQHSSEFSGGGPRAKTRSYGLVSPRQVAGDDVPSPVRDGLGRWHVAFFSIAHLFGLTLGMGAAFCLDLFFGKAMYRGRLPTHAADSILPLLRTSELGLLFLISSGVTYVLSGLGSGLNFVASEGFWTKITLVGALCITLFVSRIFLYSFVVGNSGAPVFSGASKSRQVMLLSIWLISLMTWIYVFLVASVAGIFQLDPLYVFAMYGIVLVSSFCIALLGAIIKFSIESRRRAKPFLVVDEFVDRMGI